LLQGPETRNWRGAVSAPQLEKIIGSRTTLASISYLEAGLNRARSVARVRLANGSSGTGFLTEENRLITNNHVLPEPAAAASATVQFNYQQTVDGLMAPVDELRLIPTEFFETSAIDDWTAVKVDGNPAERWGTLKLTTLKPKVGDHVNIIQHAGGGPKQISFLANVIVFVGDGRVQYLTDTLPGSSGSPVFDVNWNLVAVHHSGGWLEEPGAGAGTAYYRNEGILIDRLVERLQTGSATRSG
jgi:V8-like Glu-specific endopeptidase